MSPRGLICLAVMLTGLLLAQPATARTKGISVPPEQTIFWRSPILRSDTLAIDVMVRGRKLDSITIKNCALMFYGRGIVGHVSASGTNERVYARFANLTHRKIVVRLRIRGA